MGPISSKVTLTKEKERRKRKKERGGRKEEKRKTAMVALLVSIMAILEKKKCWTQNVHLAVTFSKIRLDIREKENSGNLRKHAYKELFHKLWSGNTHTMQVTDKFEGNSGNRTYRPC